MPTFTGTATAFNSTTRVLHDGSIPDLITPSIICHLFTQPNAPLVTNEKLGELTPMSGGGYPGAIALTSKAIELISGKNHRFTADTIEFLASGGNITDAYYYALIEDTTVDKWLIAFGQLDDTPGSVSVADGQTLRIHPHATEGFLRLGTTS